MKAREMTEIQKAWLAGFVDGEGCLGVYRKKSKSGRYENDFGIRITVVNTNLEAMQYVKALVGIGCAWESKKPWNAKWRPVHRWQAVGENAREVIRQILPYLRIKRSIAELVLTLPVNSKGGRTAEQYEAQERLFSEAKAKNRRGIVVDRSHI